MVSSSPVWLLNTSTTPLLDASPRSGFFQKPVAILTVKVEPCFKYPYLIWQSPGGSSKSSCPTGGTTASPFEYATKARSMAAITSLGSITRSICCREYTVVIGETPGSHPEFPPDNRDRSSADVRCCGGAEN